MRPTITAILTAIVLIVHSIPAPAALRFTPEELDRLQNGKTVKQPLNKSRSGGFYGGTGWAVIDAPASEVWQAITDFDTYDSYLPGTKDVKEVARQGDRSLLRMEMGNKLIRVSYHLDVTKDRANWKLSYQLAPGRANDLEGARGYWRLFPQKNGRTLVAYVAAIQMPMGIVNFLSSSLEKKLERNLLGAPGDLKKWIESTHGNRDRHSPS